MGLQKKHGKGRLDKWYKLAKEKGYRARAAFKLIQLNRKYGFLEKSKVLLDLCAAPGSWCQVAAETMPRNSLIVGLDLAPIKPIPRTITFQSDITTDKCRASIRQHIKSWKADTVLHDGAPNVGTAWVQDAFSQAELTLQALKLATEFLVEGGTFVTKVFRSKDYNALLWVFNQLFAKVEATKPPSSRNVSAEIFVVCRGFKAPKRIDPKFLDPRSVFAELSDPTPNNEAKVFNPEKKKRKRDGYEEGDYIQFKEAPASEFIQTTDPIAMLGSLNKLTFEPQMNGDIALATLEKLPETTAEIKQCCLDMKVLGRKEFRMLLRWRAKAREKFGFASKERLGQEMDHEENVEIGSMDEDLQIQEELQRLSEHENSRKRREKRRENERKQKEIIRMQMHMMPPTEIGMEQKGPNGEDSMFALAAVDNAGAAEKIVRGAMGVQVQSYKQSNEASSQEEESDEEEEELDRELNVLYSEYQERKSESDAKYRAKRSRKEHDDGDWEGFSEAKESSDEDFQIDERSSVSSEEDEDDSHLKELPHQVDESHLVLTKRASQFFKQDIFKDMGSNEAEMSDDSATDVKPPHDLLDSRSAVTSKEKSQVLEVLATQKILEIPRATSSKDYSSFDRDGTINDNNLEDTQAQAGIKAVIDHNFEIVQDTTYSEWEKQGESRTDGRLDINIITAEAMTLAQQIASCQKSKYDLIDEGYNKYTFQDRDGLPEWFLDDESKHSKPHRPVTAAGAAAIKEKLRALNARPIKKVREAKDRKKFKAAQRLEKLRRKSALVAEEDGISEKDKAQSIAKLLSKATKKRPKQQVKLVVAKGGNRGISGRPRGVKGKYKIVDARLKKDVRADMRLARKRR